MISFIARSPTAPAEAEQAASSGETSGGKEEE
jgi:hypothetical protein